MEDYRGSETRSSSTSDTSGLTGGESGELTQQDSAMTESMSTEWTNEKHNLYLKSMEASFVDQLYNSMDLLGWHPQKELSVPNLSQQVGCNKCTSSGQFKVLRNGYWQKFNARNPESRRGSENGSPRFLRSPWVQHFRSARQPVVRASPNPQDNATASQNQPNNSHGKEAMECGSPSRTKHYLSCSSCSCHVDVVDCITEMSDQNFVDEDTKGETTSSTCGSSKRMKTLMADASSSDQVVPHGKPSVAEDITSKCRSSAR